MKTDFGSSSRWLIHRHPKVSAWGVLPPAHLVLSGEPEAPFPLPTFESARAYYLSRVTK